MDIKGFFSNWIVRNLLGALVFVLALMIVANILLAVITRHNNQVVAPDFTNMTIQEALELASVSDVEVVVFDSIHVNSVRPGVVFSQQPREGEMVKKGRRISLTMNSMSVKKVSMPSLVGTSLRQARAELTSRGLLLGRLSYAEDIATNHVLKQMLRGREIPSGVMVPGGTGIDLVLGLSANAEPAYIPAVSGMKMQRAIDIIHDNSLNVGRVVYDNSVRNFTDSSRAQVYRQNPSSGLPVPPGSDVTIYLTVDTEKLQDK